MQKEFLNIMKKRYKELLIRANFNNQLYNEYIKNKKTSDNNELYIIIEERGTIDLKDDKNLLDRAFNSFYSDISDIKESDTNNIYFLTRRNVFQFECAKAGFVYDSKDNCNNIRFHDTVLSKSFGDIFMNVENENVWKFVSKEEQKDFIKNNKVILPIDCSMYYMAHKDFYETAIQSGQEAAIKKVLTKKY